MSKQATIIDTDRLKGRLERELKTLETELRSVGRKNPSNPADWEPEATEREIDVESSDLADAADNIENYELNTAILKPLEIQYNDVKAALERIKKGTYGVCEVGGESIEAERLEANPAARTCLKHREAKLD